MKNLVLLVVTVLVISQGNAQWWKSPARPSVAPAPVVKPVPAPTPAPVHPPVVTPPVVTPPPAPVHPTPAPAPAPAPAPVLKCQPWQIEKHGECICDDDVCNGWKHSHSCTAETAKGICQCSDMECAGHDQYCSELTINGACVECRAGFQEKIACGDHQSCYRNTCVCLDKNCADEDLGKDFCERQYSKNKNCVECRDNSHCGAFQICRDDGKCHCKDELCAADPKAAGNVCSSEN